VRQTGAAFAAISQQADVVNIQNGGGHLVSDIYGEDTGEVVDLFCERCTGGRFAGKRVWAVLKLIHGARDNTFDGIDGEDIGFWGVGLLASGRRGPVTGNRITGIRIRNVNVDHATDADGLRTTRPLGASDNKAGVVFGDDGETFDCFGNSVEVVASDPGPFGGFALLARRGTYRNRALVLSSKPGLDGHVGGNGDIAVSFPGDPPTRAAATMPADQAVPAGAAPATLAFSVVGEDTRANYVPHRARFVVRTPGRYRVTATLAIAGGMGPMPPGGVIRINRSGDSVARRAAAPGSVTLSATVPCARGDHLEVTVTAPRNRPVTVLAAGSSFTITAAEEDGG
jgi:hypothetical protein